MATIEAVYTFGNITDDPRRGWVSFSSRLQEHGVMSEGHGSARVVIRDNTFLKRTITDIASEVADCADVALAVHTADRLTVRTIQVQPRIHIELPVRRPELWSRPEVTEALEDLLYWYTFENWTFKFVQRNGWPRRAELQTCLPTSSESAEVALWSGGLDAYAGLLNRMLSDNPHIRSSAETFVLFGTGSDPFIQSKQRSLADSVATCAPGRTKLIQVPLEVRNNDICLARDSSQRARGFVFLLLGSVCAHLEGQDKLHVYENGIGALNLRCRQSEIGRDHPVSVHPLSLLRMSKLVSLVLGSHFTYSNPFVTLTKGQMCDIFRSDATAYLRFVPDTVSCDSLRRERPRQCGVCSSCLLRRQGLAAAGVTDQTGYHVLAHMDDMRRDDGRQATTHDCSYLLAMEYQATMLTNILVAPYSSDAWNALIDEYPLLQSIIDQTAAGTTGNDVITEEQMLQLYRRYAGEWGTEGLRQLLYTGLLFHSSQAGLTLVR